VRPVLVCLGALILDEVLLVERPPGPGEDVPARPGPAGPGGSATNVARLAAALGVPTLLVARVGEDGIGRRLAREVRAEGLRTIVQRDPRRPTGRSIAIVEPDGARRFLTLRGAEAALAFDRRLSAAIGGEGWLFASGYELEGPGARAVLRAIRTTPRAVLLDPAPVVERLPDRVLAPAVRRARIVVGTGEELAVLSARGFAPASWVEKRGAEGAAAGGGLGVATVPAARPPHGRVTDTTGAGDAFAAGLLAGLIRGSDLEGAMRIAAACGAAAVCGPGAGHALLHAARLRSRLEAGR
jgi:ribokinase